MVPCSGCSGPGARSPAFFHGGSPALAVGDPETAVQQRTDWRLTVHVLAGRDIYKLHGIESTPCFVVIDAEGTIRHIALGWSEENAEAVSGELAKLLK